MEARDDDPQNAPRLGSPFNLADLVLCALKSSEISSANFGFA